MLSLPLSLWLSLSPALSLSLSLSLSLFLPPCISLALSHFYLLPLSLIHRCYFCLLLYFVSRAHAPKKLHRHIGICYMLCTYLYLHHIGAQMFTDLWRPRQSCAGQDQTVSPRRWLPGATCARFVKSEVGHGAAIGESWLGPCRASQRTVQQAKTVPLVQLRVCHFKTDGGLRVIHMGKVPNISWINTRGWFPAQNDNLCGSWSHLCFVN